MLTSTKIARRDFIKVSTAASALLALGYSSFGKESHIVNLTLAGSEQVTELNPYIFIEASGKITIFNHRPEMGQGTFQSIPMIVADELEVDIEKITIAQSPADRSKYGDQMVVGSRSIQNNFELMRKVGATAKEMLLRAAAEAWKVKSDECYAENATIIHQSSGKKLTYGELVEKARLLAPTQNPTLKNPADFKIIGKSLPRRDIPKKTNGEAIFGMDCKVPGMLYASIQRSPVFLGKVVSVNDAAAKAVPGVKHVLKTQRDVLGAIREGVAVIANSFWAAEQGRKALEITWDNGDLENWSTQKIRDDYKKAATQAGNLFSDIGNFDQAFNSPKTIKLEASYETPYQSHACMEPMNAIVSVKGDLCEFWGSTQNPNGVRSFLSKFSGLAEEKVIINYTFMGGGFGRRSGTDVVEEAADLSKKTGVPIQVVWNREDDITQGPFRACSLNVCRAALDENGNLTALDHKIICQDIRNQSGDDMKATHAIAGGVNTEYAIPNFRMSGVLRKFYIPITYWRGVYHSTNCFAHESFMDELAQAAKKDPLDFRLGLLKEHQRYTQVLKAVAEQSLWHQPRKKDSGKGVAIVERSGAFVALVAEVQRINGKIKVVKINASIDCGTTVNPDTVKAQTEGAIVMGLTAAYKSGLTINGGKVVEKNFDSYKMLLMGECPEIVVTVVVSNNPPEGAGEAGLPPVAPAVVNAIFELTGKRIRALPFRLEEV